TRTTPAPHSFPTRRSSDLDRLPSGVVLARQCRIRNTARTATPIASTEATIQIKREELPVGKTMSDTSEGGVTSGSSNICAGLPATFTTMAVAKEFVWERLMA